MQKHRQINTVNTVVGEEQKNDRRVGQTGHVDWMAVLLVMQERELIQLDECSSAVEVDVVLNVGEKNEMIALMVVNRANIARVQMNDLVQNSKFKAREMRRVKRTC